LPTVARG
jgi:hypothetical protein